MMAFHRLVILLVALLFLAHPLSADARKKKRHRKRRHHTPAAAVMSAAPTPPPAQPEPPAPPPEHKLAEAAPPAQAAPPPATEDLALKTKRPTVHERSDFATQVHDSEDPLKLRR